MTNKRNVVAIVDDDLEVRRALEKLVSAHGYSTQAYASAEDFIRESMTSEAACLVVDIQLGDISGVELGRHLSAIGLTFPIIFITGSQEEAHRRQAMDFGCVAYLQKPIAGVDLIDAIKKAIGCGPDQDESR